MSETYSIFERYSELTKEEALGKAFEKMGLTDESIEKGFERAHKAAKDKNHDPEDILFITEICEGSQELLRDEEYFRSLGRVAIGAEDG